MGFQIVQEKINHEVSKIRSSIERYDLRIHSHQMCIV